MTPDDVTKTLQEIESLTTSTCYNLLQIGQKFAELKRQKAHKVMGYERWDEFIRAYTSYDRAYVDFCIRIHEKFGHVLGHEVELAAIPFSRLRDALPIVKTKEEAEEVLENAIHLPYGEWQKYLSEKKTGIAPEECLHPNMEEYVLQYCPDCKLKMKNKVVLNDSGG